MDGCVRDVAIMAFERIDLIAAPLASNYSAGSGVFRQDESERERERERSIRRFCKRTG